MQTETPVKYAYFSIAASIITLCMKFGAYFMTDSVGLLSDATESLVNVAAGILALTVLIIATRPADPKHTYGHGKAEYFSSGTEGILIIVAACGIVYAAVGRFSSPTELNNLGIGLSLALASSGVNWITAKAMLRAAERFDSITLEADARHLLTDVWTSGGLVVGLSILLVVPEWAILDPVIAIIMACNIVLTGVSLIKRSLSGLMDTALPEEDVKTIMDIISVEAGPDIPYHALRTRKSGAHRFADFHILVSGDTSVKDSHNLCCRIEDAIEKALPGIQITIHVEPKEDAASHDGWLVGGLCSQRKSCGKCDTDE